MTNRKDMDRPATVTAAVFGVVLIAVSLLLFGLGSAGSGGKTYNVVWSQASLGSKATPSGTQGSVAKVVFDVNDKLVSNVTVSFNPCSDTAGVGGNAATLTWTLYANDAALKSGSGACPVPATTVPVSSHSDIGSATNQAALWGHSPFLNQTIEYRLEFSWTRPAGTVPVPLPVGGSSFSAVGQLEVKAWSAVLNAKTEGSK